MSIPSITVLFAGLMGPSQEKSQTKDGEPLSATESSGVAPTSSFADVLEDLAKNGP